MKLSYDESTDSLYIELRDLPAEDTRILSDDVAVDLAADGKPVGYDVQHASRNGAAISEALSLARSAA